MRAVWTMGFVAAAALSFLFPDFIVFRFTQAVVWAIALVGLVLLCGISGQFSFAQAALYGMGGYTAAILANHTSLSLYWSIGLAPLVGYGAGYGLGRVAGSHSIWTQALISYALAIAFPQLLRWRLDRAVDRRRAGPLHRPAGGARPASEQRPLVLLPGARLAGAGPVARRQRHRQPLRPCPDGRARS